MKSRITAQTFEFAKTAMVKKNNIEENKVYVLYIEGKGESGETFWQVDVDVWFDSGSGTALMPLGDKDLILLGKNKYGDEWYLTK